MSRSFHPPQRTLLGPGPSDVSPRVLAAMARPTIGHLDPAFIGLMDDLKRLLQSAFRTQNALTMPVSGPGTAGMETCFVNLVEPGDVVIVGINGVFGGRMKQMVERCGGIAVVVDHPWGQPVDADRIDEALTAHPGAKAVAFVHAETSTGASSNAEQIAKVAQAHGALTIVDAVTSLAGSPLEVDAWGLDAVYSGSQKCLSCTPGLSPITFNERAVAAIKARKTPVQSWFMDLTLVMGYWGSGKRSYHHTAPINALYALHESLLILDEEGVENAWSRHQRNHLALRAGLEALGISYVVAPEHSLAQLNAVTVPKGVDDAAARRSLLLDHDLEIGGGLGALAGKVWRIGLMGHASRPTNVLRCLTALEAVLQGQGVSVAGGQAVRAAKAAFANT